MFAEMTLISFYSSLFNVLDGLSLESPYMAMAESDKSRIMYVTMKKTFRIKQIAKILGADFDGKIRKSHVLFFELVKF